MRETLLLHHAHRRQRGFSLLEALIAVALLAALAALMSPAIRNILKLSAEILARAEERENLRVVEDALTRILSNAIVMDGRAPDMRLFGDARSLTVISLAGGSTARRFVLSVEDGRLKAAIAPIMEGSDPPVTTQFLTTGAGAFSYYGRATPDAPLGWTDRWTAPLPPRLIRFEIAQSNQESPRFFEIALTASAPLHCEFDPVSRQCRS